MDTRQETQQEKEARWRENRANRYPQQQNSRAARSKASGRNWVGGVKRTFWALVDALKKRVAGLKK